MFSSLFKVFFVTLASSVNGLGGVRSKTVYDRTPHIHKATSYGGGIIYDGYNTRWYDASKYRLSQKSYPQCNLTEMGDFCTYFNDNYTHCNLMFYANIERYSIFNFFRFDSYYFTFEVDSGVGMGAFNGVYNNEDYELFNFYSSGENAVGGWDYGNIEYDLTVNGLDDYSINCSLINIKVEGLPRIFTDYFYSNYMFDFQFSEVINGNGVFGVSTPTVWFPNNLGNSNYVDTVNGPYPYLNLEDWELHNDVYLNWDTKFQCIIDVDFYTGDGFVWDSIILDYAHEQTTYDHSIYFTGWEDNGNVFQFTNDNMVCYNRMLYRNSDTGKTVVANRTLTYEKQYSNNYATIYKSSHDNVWLDDDYRKIYLLNYSGGGVTYTKYYNYEYSDVTNADFPGRHYSPQALFSTFNSFDGLNGVSTGSTVSGFGGIQNITNIMNVGLGGLFGLFGAEILPGISLGILIFLPLVFSLLLFVVKLFKR